ncbi:MAG: pirin family protein [Gammaproteobacteria bacterium]
MRQTVLSGGLSVVRALPLGQRHLGGPWCFFDLYGPKPYGQSKAMDIAPHPHIGLETVSWLFDGEILHEDSLGSSARVVPREVNLMSAGRGIAHAELTPFGRCGILHGIQLWIALTEQERHRPPRFDHYSDSPRIEFPHGYVTIFAGEFLGARAPARAPPLVGAELRWRTAGTFPLVLNPGWEHALVVVSGAAGVENHTLATGFLHDLGCGRNGLEFKAHAPACAVLIGRVPFGESILMWWHFVAQMPEEIAHARDDWENHRLFGEVKNYHGERLNAPPLILRPSQRFTNKYAR